MSLMVDQLVTQEQALAKLKKDIEQNATRASSGFREHMKRATLRELDPVIKYAPIYHVQTKGSFDKNAKKDLNFIVDKNHKSGMIAISKSYTEDKRKVIKQIDNQEALKLPVLTPLLTLKNMADEISQNASQNHKGTYSLSDISIVLVLVPIVKFTFIHDGVDYDFLVNLYDGHTDAETLPITDTDPAIEGTFNKLEKAHKWMNFTKIGMLAVLAIDLIIAIIKGDNLNGTDIGSCIFLWVLITGSMFLLMWLPRKRQKNTWTELKDDYWFDDRYIKDNGKITIRTWIHLIGYALPIVIPAFWVIFITGLVLQ